MNLAKIYVSNGTIESVFMSGKMAYYILTRNDMALIVHEIGPGSGYHVIETNGMTTLGSSQFNDSI